MLSILFYTVRFVPMTEGLRAALLLGFYDKPNRIKSTNSATKLDLLHNNFV